MKPSKKQMREALAYMYQYAGATGASVKVLDNLSALIHNELPPHEWEYPALPHSPSVWTGRQIPDGDPQHADSK